MVVRFMMLSSDWLLDFEWRMDGKQKRSGSPASWPPEEQRLGLNGPPGEYSL